MALNEIRIVVVNGGGAGGSTAKAKTPEQIEREANKMKNKKLAATIKAFSDPVDAATDKITGKMSPSAAFATNMAMQVGTQFVKQAIDFYVSDIGRRNGDSNYQAIVNHKMEIVNDVMNVGQAMAGGAVAGATVGGVPGALIGMVLGGISAGMSIGFRQAERERAYAHEMFKSNNNQAYNISRAGINVLSGRLR
jgi:hypothetical protein